MTKHTDKLQMIEIDKLIPYVNNAHTHSDDQIKKIQSSLREFGFVNPVLIDKEYGIIAGHGRVKAAKRENIKEVPCVMVEYLTPAQKKAYILADNRFAQDAGWDEELLKLEIESLQGTNFDVALTGFEDQEIADLFTGEDDSEAQDDDFDLSAALEKTSFVEKGDVWYVGRHKLMCGDATSAEDVTELMDGKKANLILTDPPYGVSFESSDGLTIQNDSMKVDEFYDFSYSAWGAYYSEDDATEVVGYVLCDSDFRLKSFDKKGYFESSDCVDCNKEGICCTSRGIANGDTLSNVKKAYGYTKLVAYSDDDLIHKYVANNCPDVDVKSRWILIS